MKVFLKDIKDRFPEFEIKNYDDTAYFTTFSYDTRDDVQGSIYIPIVGPKFDGHNFIKMALEQGANMSFCENGKADLVDGVDKPIIFVDSIEEGLEKVLDFALREINKPIVAITGSTGKTTTKRMLVKILQTEKKVLWSDHSNTVWGNAALLSKYTNEDIIVLECATDRRGEIAWHMNSCNPDIVALLNIGFVHAETIGSVEDIYEEKKNAADYIRKTGKTLILNIDDERLHRIYDMFTEDYRLVTYGKDSKANFRIERIDIKESGTDFEFSYYDDNFIKGKLSVYGEGFVYDAMAAIIIASEFGISVDGSVKALEDFASSDGRFQRLDYGDNLVIINDAYNANPYSMDSSLETFSKLFADEYHTIAILGDMKELGYMSDTKHKELGNLVNSFNFNEIYYVGENYEKFGVGEKLDSADEVAAMLNYKIPQLKNKKIAILLKASNSVGLYRVPDYLKNLDVV